MLVLAIDTGEKVDKETAWFCNKNRKYYTSKEGYQKWLKHKANQRYYQNKKSQARKLSEIDKEYFKKCNDKFYDWLGYTNTAPKPSIFFRRMKCWHDNNQCSYEVIYITMEMIEKDVFRVLQYKSFDSELCKVSYICGMINNSLIDGQKLYNRKQQAIAEAQQQAVNEHYPTQEELEMAWVQHDRTKELESIARVNETLNSILGEGWDE